jgi:ferredoxin-NADP reductase/ferredoxin
MIKSVEVVPGCIACKTCEGICPQVFKVEGTSHVIGYDFERYRQAVLRAERMCPVNVIKVERDDADEVADVFSQGILAKRTDLTADVLELRFFVKNFSAIPGQYVSLRLRDDAGEFIRSYSLVDFSESHFTLCVKILADGRGGRVLSRLSSGDAVSVSPAVGHFTLRDTSAPKVFIATGTGLAPMMAMLSATPDTTPRVVIFGVRLQEDLFYLDQLHAYPNTRVIATLSSPTANWTGDRGRVLAHLDAVA